MGRMYQRHAEDRCWRARSESAPTDANSGTWGDGRVSTTVPGRRQRTTTYSLLERGQTDALLLLSLHRVVHPDAGSQDMNLPLGKQGHARQEGAATAQAVSASSNTKRADGLEPVYLEGFLNESGKKKPNKRPENKVKAPMRTNNQNQPGLPLTPRM